MAELPDVKSALVPAETEYLRRSPKPGDLLVSWAPLAYYDFFVDINIAINEEKGRYTADIFALQQKQSVPINMSPLDLLALNRRLQEEMQVIANENIPGKGSTRAMLNTQLGSLAKVGHYAFRRVFGRDDTLAAMVIQSALQAVRNQVGNSRAVSIQITSEKFFLPWELIYPVSLDEPPSYEHFWGMSSIVYRIAEQVDCPRPIIENKIEVADCPRLGLLTYCGLSAVEKKEIPFFEKLAEDGKIALFRLRALDPSREWEEFKTFKRFLGNAFHLAHFACHAFYEGDSPEQSRILLSDEFPITLMDMEVHGIAINGHPLIIMNACETGNLNPLYTSYFSAAFLRYGARGVVATECAVPDDFAADFAEQLYTHLLAGEPLGESLLATRRYFLDKFNNPSGLLYSMYAPPSIRLAQTGG